MKKLLFTLTGLALINCVALADVVYVTALPTPSGPGPNPDGTYSDSGGGDTSIVGTGVGAPARSGCRYFSNGFSNNTAGVSGIILTPTLGVPGGIYQIYHNFNSTAGNVSTNISLSVTCTVSGTLNFWNSGTNFISAAGNPTTQWKLLGFLTNDIGSTTPTIEFGYLDGHVSAGANQRLLADVFRFTLYEPCLDIPVVGVTGPLATNVDQVVVTGVLASATNVNVYQNSGTGMVLIGAKTTAVTAGNNTVTVVGLVKGAQVAATQTITGQEGCVPTSGTIVGGGANPRVRVVFSIRETSSTGPVGRPGSTASTFIHFLGATNRIGSAPGSGPVISPSASWQTVTLTRGLYQQIGDSANVVGTAADGSGYLGNDSVAIQVFAYRTVGGVSGYSVTEAQSAAVTSNDVFTVNWTWDAVAGAEGYRLVRDLNGLGYSNYVDVVANSYNDANTGWAVGSTTSPKATQTTPSIQWNPSNPSAIVNTLSNQWGTLESINFAIDDLSDTGPYDLYIDNLQNGATLFQDFELAPATTTSYGFLAPGTSGTTSANLLTSPNQGIVSNDAADTGTKSFRVRFQWSGTNSSRWIRLTTSGVGNPQVNLDDPISVRILLLPVNSTLTPPTAPTLSIGTVADQRVLNWTGGHRLQTSVGVAGTYTNVPQVKSANTWTNVDLGAFLSPWTNAYPESQRFFRLRD